MRAGSLLRAWLAFGLVVGGVLLGTRTTEATGNQPRPDLQVALSERGRCGPFADRLPTLFAAVGLKPGDRTRIVEICLRNRGAAAGRLTLGVTDRLDLDLVCTADEPALDPECRLGRPGELGRNLVVLAGPRPGCGNAAPAIEAGLVALETSPALLNADLRRDRTDCLSLQVEYRPASDAEAIASQTDNVFWRFAFQLTG
jgi:hypothetical protein